MKTFQVSPLNNNIFIIEDKEKEKTTTSGLIVNPNSGKPITGVGTIVAVSQATIDFVKEEQGVDIEVGSRVYFSRFSTEDVFYFENGLRVDGLQKIHVSSLAGVINE